MNKLFKPRCLRRILLCLALLFPIVYLCGGLFFALAGAHGENVLATDETSIVDRKIIDFNQINDSRNLGANIDSFEDGIYTTRTLGVSTVFTALNRSFNIIAGHKYIQTSSVLNSSNNSRLQIWDDTYSTYRSYFVSGSVYTSQTDSVCSVNLVYSDSDTALQFRFMVTDLTQAYGLGNEPTAEEFYSDFPQIYYSFTLSEIVFIPVYGVPNEQNSLFYHIFGQRNFISQLGTDLINGSTKGFVPMNSLFNYVNSNVFHFESSDSLAMFGFGYVYYAVNVLIVYEILILAVKLIMLPLKAVDVFYKEDI